MPYKFINDIQVELLNAEEVKTFPPELVIGEFASICHRGDIKDPRILKGIARDCIEKGHGSAIRVAKFRFRISNIDMATGEQIIRSVIGTEVQKDEVKINKISRRYTKLLTDDLYVPESIARSKYKDKYIQLHQDAYDLYIRMVEDEEEDIKEEDARCANLWGSTTGINIEYSLQALLLVCEDRLCMRTQKPYRMVTNKLVKEVRKVNPFIAQYLVCKCDKLGYCPENIGCRALKQKDAILLLKQEYAKSRNKGKPAE